MAGKNFVGGVPAEQKANALPARKIKGKIKNGQTSTPATGKKYRNHGAY
jgi:hypothetical protein